MNSFQITVLTIFVVLAILILTAFAILLNSKKDKKSEYPTTYNTCPDYWDVSGNTCVSNNSVNNGINSDWIKTYDQIKKSGTPGYDSSAGNPTINFNDPSWNNGLYPGVSGRCALKQWANTYGIVWDGVTNYTGASC